MMEHPKYYTRMDGASIAQSDSQGRYWTVFERSDRSICVYWTRQGDPAKHVVYDTLDAEKP